MYDERDFIARQFSVEEQMAKAANTRLVHHACRARHARRTGICAAFLRWTSRLLIRAGQRLENIADAGSLFGAATTYPSLPESSTGQRE